jgi:hypothetical protein
MQAGPYFLQSAGPLFERFDQYRRIGPDMDQPRAQFDVMRQKLVISYARYAAR